MPAARPRAQRARPRTSTPTTTPASAPPTSSTSPIATAPAPDPLSVVVDGLRYVLDAPPRRQGKKNIITIRHAGDGDGAGLIDRVDLFAHRSRERLARLIADNFGRDVGTIMGHIALLLDTAERAAAHAGGATADEPLTAERRRAAEELLGEPTSSSRPRAPSRASGSSARRGPPGSRSSWRSPAFSSGPCR